MLDASHAALAATAALLASTAIYLRWRGAQKTTSRASHLTGNDHAATNASMQVDLSGRRVLVTGAGSGIGMEIALTLALRCNAHVVALDYNDEGLVKLQTLAAERGGSDECIRGLVANLLAMEETMDAVRAEMNEHGPFVGLVNCAGIAKFETVFETTVSEFDRQYGVNVKPCIYLTQVVAERLVKHDPPLTGSVVHISSQSSTLAIKEHLVYSSGKAAVDHVGRIQALEFGEHGLRVNTVRPTVVLTELALKVRPKIAGGTHLTFSTLRVAFLAAFSCMAPGVGPCQARDHALADTPPEAGYPRSCRGGRGMAAVGPLCDGDGRCDPRRRWAHHGGLRAMSEAVPSAAQLVFLNRSCNGGRRGVPTGLAFAGLNATTTTRPCPGIGRPARAAPESV